MQSYILIYPRLKGKLKRRHKLGQQRRKCANISIGWLLMAVSIIPSLQAFHGCFYNTSIASFSWLFYNTSIVRLSMVVL